MLCNIYIYCTVETQWFTFHQYFLFIFEAGFKKMIEGQYLYSYSSSSHEHQTVRNLTQSPLSIHSALRYSAEANMNLQQAY